MSYSDFKNFKVINDFDAINLNISEGNRNKEILEKIKQYYIDSHKLIQFLAAKVGQDLYINNSVKNKNILLEYTRVLSTRYYELMKAFCKDKFNNSEEALNFLISFYICEEDEDSIKNFGNLGSNIRAWINLMERKGNSSSSNESEFRNRLYFVYKIRMFVSYFFKHLDLNNSINNKSKYHCNDKNYFDNNLRYNKYITDYGYISYQSFEKEIYKTNIRDINKFLINWKIDPKFISYMLNRLNDDKNLDQLTPKNNLLVFQFGEAARQNWAIRTLSRSEAEYKEIEKQIWKEYNTKDQYTNSWKISYEEAKRRSDENKAIYEATKKSLELKKSDYFMPSYNDVYKGESQYKSPKMVFNTKLSDQEIFSLLGELPNIFNSKSKSYNFNQLNHDNRNYAYKPGAVYYFYKEQVDREKFPFAYEFLQKSKENYLPIVSGISGSMDLSLTMAGLVGLGLKNGKTDFKYLQTIKLVYVVWMGLGYDHTLHEMLYSAKSFGLEYKPGPNIASYIYPNDPNFILCLKNEMKKYSYLLPNEYYGWFDSIRKNSNPLNKQIDSTLKLIANCNALGRLLRNDNYYYQTDVYKESIALYDPNQGVFGVNVPVPTNRSRSIVFNPQTKKQENRVAPLMRNTDTNRKYTKKLSTTLIRPDGNINFFDGVYDTPVGFIHNANLVNNKDWKYVFNQNGYTNYKWWVGNENANNRDFRKSIPAISINKLKKHLLVKSKNFESASDYNEVLVGLSKESFCGMFAPKNDDTHIMSLISAYVITKNNLNIHFTPTFIFDKRKTKSFIKRKYNPIVNVLTFETAISVVQREKEKNSKEFYFLNYCLFNNLSEQYLKAPNNVYMDRIKDVFLKLFVSESDKKYIEDGYHNELVKVLDSLNKNDNLVSF